MQIISLLFILLLSACAGIQARYHTIKEGDTLVKVAAHYDVPVRKLEAYNKVEHRRGLRAGQKLYIPYESKADWNEEFYSKEVLEKEFDNSADSAIAIRREPTVEKTSLQDIAFSWPVMGQISSQYGYRKHRHHDGIDIVAPTGAKVKSARSGHVIYSGNGIPGYGNLVIVKHSDDFSTVYAHLSKILTRKGQFVSRGQKVGLVGRTGRASGPHLHFEIRKNRSPENPLFYLRRHLANNILTRRTATR
jgi:murein DD-endopeptidase MepM/ murein hydrolase activator NlpD